MKTFFATMLVAAGAMAIKIADPKDFAKARELGSQYVDSEKEAIRMLKNASKEDAMEFCSDDANKQICDFVMNMADKYDVTEDDVAAW
ncbi:MAG: hypothetical protein GY836_20635 [Herbaspirillum sp.]|nr:hypothetical protein [Herbaspirillum sp.]